MNLLRKVKSTSEEITFFSWDNTSINKRGGNSFTIVKG